MLRPFRRKRLSSLIAVFATAICCFFLSQLRKCKTPKYSSSLSPGNSEEGGGKVNALQPESRDVFPTIDELEKQFSHLEAGGHFRPTAGSRVEQTVTLIIPYRKREVHLRAFLLRIHSLLKEQFLDYSVFIVEPKEGQEFNRAKLLNIGFVEAKQPRNSTCYIFHDVDLLPENDEANLYTCNIVQPIHMSAAVDKHCYEPPYQSFYGGIVAFTGEQFERLLGLRRRGRRLGPENILWRLSDISSTTGAVPVQSLPAWIGSGKFRE